MPAGSIIITTDATLHRGSGILGAEKGRLVGVNILTESTQRGSAELFGEIYLVSMEVPTPIRLLSLASGYFGVNLSVAWDGNIELEPAMGIQGFITCVLETRCILTVLTEL